MAGNDGSAPIRVLLVDDDAESAEMYRMRLAVEGLTVEWARDGREGLRLAHAWGPDLVLLDVRMPEMDGIEVLRALRAEPATAALPVVVLTNYSDDALRRRAEGLGILEWRSKMETTPRRMSGWIKHWSATSRGR